jgi:GNAT superfamily N-acetyltransferase
MPSDLVVYSECPGTFKGFMAAAWAQFYRKLYPASPQEQFVSGESVFIGAYDVGQQVGGLQGGFWGGVLAIEELIIDPAYRSQGIGQELLQAAEKWALAQGGHALQLQTGNAWPAKKFYLKCGFEVLTVMPHFYFGTDYVLLVKRLEGQVREPPKMVDF